MTKQRPMCTACGSDEVQADAYAAWELTTTFDKGHVCEHCEGPCSIRWDDLPDDAGIRHDMHGFYLLTVSEEYHEDEGNPSVGFDGRPHYDTLEEARSARDA